MKAVKYLLVSSLFVGFPASATWAAIDDNQVNALVESLKQAAPPNRPSDGMYSSWQVLPGIIPSWTKRCLGKAMTPLEFEAQEKSARQVVSCIVRRELQAATQNTTDEKSAVKKVACWWMTGMTQGCRSGATATYVQRVLGFYQQQKK